MEIKRSTESINVPRTSDAAPKHTRPPAVDGGGSFQQSRALDASLAQAPDIRPSEVERGQKLVSLNQYPPIEMMHKIARLLAAASDDAQ